MSLKPCVFIDLKTGKRYNYDEFRQFLYENPKFWEEKRGAVEREPGLMSKAASVVMPGNYEVAALQVIMRTGVTKELLFKMYGKNTGFAEYDRKQIQGEVDARKWMIRKTGPKTIDRYGELVEEYMREHLNPDVEYDYSEAVAAVENAIQEFRNFPEMARRILEIAGEYDVSKYEDEYVKYMMRQQEAQEEVEQEEVERKALSEEEYKELERQIAEEYIKREQEDADESEKMFGKPLPQEEYDKMRRAWDEEFAEREFTRTLTPEQKQALANLELAMLGLSNAKEAYENEVRKQARGSQQELFGSNPMGFAQNESPQALKDKLDRLKTAVDMAQAVADKALAAYQREMGMETRQGELFGGQKSELPTFQRQQVKSMDEIDVNQFTGTAKSIMLNALNKWDNWKDYNKDTFVQEMFQHGYKIKLSDDYSRIEYIQKISSYFFDEYLQNENPIALLTGDIALKRELDYEQVTEYYEKQGITIAHLRESDVRPFDFIKKIVQNSDGSFTVQVIKRNWEDNRGGYFVEQYNVTQKQLDDLREKILSGKIPSMAGVSKNSDYKTLVEAFEEYYVPTEETGDRKYFTDLDPVSFKLIESVRPVEVQPEKPPVTTSTVKNPKARAQTIKNTKLADAAAKNAEKLKGSMDELKNAFNDLLKEMGKQGPATMNGIRTEVLEKAVKVVGIMIKVGIYKFADIIIQVQQQLGDVSDELFQAIKKAYLAYASDAAEDVFEQMDTARDIRGVLLTDIFAPADEVVEEDPFENAIRDSIKNKTPLNIVAMRKLLPGVSDTDIQERVESIVVNMAREIAQTTMSDAQKLNAIENIYNYQPTLNQRDSTRVQLQQYSTPLPFAFIASSFAATKNPTLTLEPSAGNGALTIAIDPAKVVANEIDKERLANLQNQGFAEVTNQDALLPFDGTFDAVVMNPPFGSQGMRNFGTETKYQLTGLDPIMTANALESMTNNGVAAIIVGGHTGYAADGIIESRKDRIFLNYLYHYYNVLDVINVDGSLYRKQGTTYPTRLILINGRKQTPGGIAPIRSQVSDEMIAPVTDYNTLMARVQNAKDVLLQSKLDQGIVDSGKQNQTGTGTGTGKGTGGVGGGMGTRTTTTTAKEQKPVIETKEGERTGIGEEFTGETQKGEKKELEETDIDIEAEKVLYKPMSKGKSVGTYQPTAMAAETRRVLNQIQEQYGDIDEFVARELGYKSVAELHKGLYAEQVDAVAMAIAQIKTGNSLIVGDMTGVGKGRIAASIIRYGVKQGKTPVFITEKPELFSDMYRDLKGIGAESLVPLIVNTDSKANITEVDIDTEEQTTIYRHLSKEQLDDALRKYQEKGELPKQFNYVMATYSQFRGSGPSNKKILMNLVAAGNILIMDESHNASGEESQTNEYMTNLINSSSGALFLSATWAKRPGNMPIYAMKTAMRDTNLSGESLINAIKEGGVALQEIISAQLAQSGQMVRRERDFMGVEMNYTSPENDQISQQQKQQADQVISLVRKIIVFQRVYVRAALDALRQEYAEAGIRISEKQKSKDFGVKNTPFASKLFNVMQQLIFSVKAEQVAQEAIRELQNGRKPVIGFQSTMESFLKDMGFAYEEVIPNIDFSLTLLRGLDKTLEFKDENASGTSQDQRLSPEELGPAGEAAYYALRAEIQQSVSGITISPIDAIKNTIERAGYKVAEVTGRKTVVEILPNQGAILKRRGATNKKQMVADFNNGKVDVIMLNASGATGLSMHSSVDFKDQRQRIMIIAQPPFDVNTFIQMLGRIDRTGQVVRGAYNIMLSSIPAEGRFQIMLKKKVASLLANTTAQQESSSVDIQVADILNKYGDQIVTEYLIDNPEINNLLDDPLNLGEQIDDASKIEVQPDAAEKVLKKVSLLYTKEQEAFYNEVSSRFEALINYLNSMDENDLKVVSVPLQAETLYRQVFAEGSHTGTPFGEDAVIEVVEANVLRKPMTPDQIKSIMDKATGGESSLKYMADKIDQVEEYYKNFAAEESNRLNDLKNKEIEAAKQQIYSNENFDKDFPTAEEAEAARERAIEQAVESINDAYALRTTNILERINKQRVLVKQFLNSMKIGKLLKVPMFFSEKHVSALSVPGIVMNIEFGTKTKNPFAPSNITFVIAVRDGRRQLKFPLSKTDVIQQINLRSNNVEQQNLDDFFAKWEKDTKYIEDREVRFIMSGNILLGYGQMRGPLVSYTTKDGKIRKGILYRPGQLNLDTLAGQKPITAAYEQVMETKKPITATNAPVTISHTQGGIYISVPKSTKDGGTYFKDEELLSLSKNGEFNSRGKQMVAEFTGNNAKAALDLLAKKHNLIIPGDKMPAEVVAEINERMRRQGMEVAPTPSSIQATAEAAKKEYKPVITNVEIFTDPRTGKEGVKAYFKKISSNDYDVLKNIAKIYGGRYSPQPGGFVFEKGSDAVKFQQDAEKAIYEQVADTTQMPQSLFDRLVGKIDELIEREKNLPPGSVAYSSIIPIPPQVARAISIGALRAAKAVILAAKAANNFTKATMQAALAAAEQYVRNYMSDPAKFKPSQVEDMVKRVKAMMEPVNPVTVATEAVAENSELVKEITSAADKAFEKMSALVAKEGMKRARKQAIDLLKTILGGSKVPLNPKLIEAILAKFPKSNTDKALLNFIEYAVGMVQSEEKIKKLQMLVNKARAELDKPYAGAEMKARLKPLLRTIEAHKVSPDKIDMLGLMLQGFIAQMAGKNYKSVSINNLIDALTEQGAYIDEQTMIRRRALMQVRIDRLIEEGGLAAGTTIDQYEQMLAQALEQEQADAAQEPPQPAQLSETAELLIPEIKVLMADGKAKADAVGTSFVKRMFRWLGKLNLTTLSDTELKRVHNILNDYIELDDLSDLGVYAARGEAQERLMRLTTLNNNFRQYKGNISKMSLNNLLENISSSEDAKNTLRAELYQREEVLFGDVKKRTDDNLQALEAHIIETKMDERAVRSTEIYNILNQAGSQGATWQEWRTAMMSNWLKYLSKKQEERRLMSSVLPSILQRQAVDEEIRIAEQTINILENEFDPEAIAFLEDAINADQAKLAKMVRTFYAEISEEFRQNTAAFFSKLFDPMENPMYVSLNVIDRLGKGGIDESYSPTLTDTVFEEARIDRSESRTAIERTKFVNNSVVYGTDLLANFRKRYYQTLYQAKLSEELFVMDRMIKSEQFKSLFDPKYSDRTTKVLLTFMEGVVDGQRYFGYIGISDQPMVKKLVNGNIGAVLVDLIQLAKQSIGSLQLLGRANFKLVGWALKTAFAPTKEQKNWLDSVTTLRDRTYQSESVVSKQYAELNKFAGKTWARKLLSKIGDAIKNTRNAFAKYTIEKADRFVSGAALFAGYAKSLKEQGLINKVSDINWANETANPNYNALAAAENIADELNVPSNQTTKAEVLRSEKKSIKDFTTKEINWMLGQFDLNAYNNMYNNWRTLMDNSGTVSRSEKWDAGVKVFSILLNTQAYAATKVLMDVLYTKAAIALAMWAMGMDFEDEDEEEKKRRQQKSLYAASMLGIFNLFIGKYGNVFKILPRLGLAAGFSWFYQDKEQTEENKGTLKDPNTDLFYDPTGVPVVDLAVREMVQLSKAIKKEDDAYELARTAGMFASFAVGFATIERITTKTTREMEQSPLRKDEKRRESIDVLGEKKFGERKAKLFKYLKEGHIDYAKTIFDKMTGPSMAKEYPQRINAVFQAIVENMESDKVGQQDGGANYFGALLYGLGIEKNNLSVTLPGQVEAPLNILLNTGEWDNSTIRRIVQKYEDQYQANLTMMKNLKEVDPDMGKVIYEMYKPGGTSEPLMLNSYGVMRRDKKKGAVAYDIPK